MKFRRAILIAFAMVLIGHGAIAANVGLTEDANSLTLANGIITARVLKQSGDLVSLKYKNLEMMGQGSGHPAGYWSHTPDRDSKVIDTVTIDPKTNNGERAECSIKVVSGGSVVGRGPGGGVIADVEIRYALGRNDSGLYTYCIMTHRPEYPVTSLGEARFAAKLNAKIFDYMTIDANRRKVMPKPEDWDRGTQLNMKEARRLNTGIYKGQVEHKYDYSAVQFDIPAFGWSSSEQRVGLWFVNPTIEYLSGGATKVELTAHLDNGNGADPTVLNYWRGSHYGGSSCVMTNGENWTKVIGPFLIYCNSGESHEAMWKDALAKAASESNAWPYDWVNGVDYPHKGQRGIVSGQLVLKDAFEPNVKMSNILVGLATPDYTLQGSRNFGPRMVDWQMDAKHYEFWTRADEQGRFTISKVRPGNYTLHAIADGVLGEFVVSNIAVSAAQTVSLGALEWHPVRHGRQIWEIGVPDRTAREFFHGDDYWHWGLYLDYPKEFPSDVNFIIGKSDWRKDWNFCQVPRNEDGTRGSGTTWSVTFGLPSAPHGKATLRLAFAGASARNVQVTVNEQSAGNTGPLPDTGTIRRDAIRGYWFEREVPFDATLLKDGKNVLKLTIPAGGVMNGVEYDYLRLELDENASAPKSEQAKS